MQDKILRYYEQHMDIWLSVNLSRDEEIAQLLITAKLEQPGIALTALH